MLFFVQWCIQKYPPSNTIICSSQIALLRRSNTSSLKKLWSGLSQCLLWKCWRQVTTNQKFSRPEDPMMRCSNATVSRVSQSRKSRRIFHSGPNMAPPDSICRFFHTWLLRNEVWSSWIKARIFEALSGSPSLVRGSRPLASILGLLGLLLFQMPAFHGETCMVDWQNHETKKPTNSQSYRSTVKRADGEAICLTWCFHSRKATNNRSDTLRNCRLSPHSTFAL